MDSCVEIFINLGCAVVRVWPVDVQFCPTAGVLLHKLHFASDVVHKQVIKVDHRR